MELTYIFYIILGFQNISSTLHKRMPLFGCFKRAALGQTLSLRFTSFNRSRNWPIGHRTRIRRKRRSKWSELSRKLLGSLLGSFSKYNFQLNIIWMVNRYMRCRHGYHLFLVGAIEVKNIGQTARVLSWTFLGWIWKVKT